jgi:hypothetical protein
VLPGRLGARFALEALFLVLLAIGAGLADLRPAFIILVMAVAWLLVALVELTAERIARSPVSYLLPAEKEAVAAEPEPEQVFGPPIEERTVVAPPQALEDTQEPIAQPEPEPEPEPKGEQAEAESLELPTRRRLGTLLRRAPTETEPEPEPDVPLAGQTAPEAEDEVPEPEIETATRGRFRSLLRRREQEIEPLPEPPPRHVKLLPRRSESEPGPGAREVAELFDPREDGADAEETAG